MLLAWQETQLQIIPAVLVSVDPDAKMIFAFIYFSHIFVALQTVVIQLESFLTSALFLLDRQIPEDLFQSYFLWESRTRHLPKTFLM